MRQHFGTLIASALALACAGCVPASYVKVPAIRGRVVDQGGHPIEKAVIQIVRDSDGAQMGNVSTDINGTFARAEQSSLIFQIAGADRAVSFYSVIASKGDRKSPAKQVTDDVRRWFLVFYDPPADRDLGDFQLP